MKKKNLMFEKKGNFLLQKVQFFIGVKKNWNLERRKKLRDYFSNFIGLECIYEKMLERAGASGIKYSFAGSKRVKTQSRTQSQCVVSLCRFKACDRDFSGVANLSLGR